MPLPPRTTEKMLTLVCCCMYTSISGEAKCSTCWYSAHKARLGADATSLPTRTQFGPNEGPQVWREATATESSCAGAYMHRRSLFAHRPWCAPAQSRDCSFTAAATRNLGRFNFASMAYRLNGNPFFLEGR
jgi:hypothetical protein